ncbi:MAG: hypothetical protein IJZ19_13190 [Lentisphaeria bacterium]|nr:hypothetical protein [Lentisphaeria bacterium]
MKRKIFLLLFCLAGTFGSYAVDGVVNATALNARLRPELASPVAMKLAKNAVVNVLAAKGNFYEIAVPDYAPVYVSAAYIGQDGKLFKDQQMRVKPAVGAASYGVIPAGTAVETVKVDRYGWARIKPPKALKLYVASFYIDLKGKLEETPAPEVKKEVAKAAAPEAAPEVKKEEAKAAAPEAAPEVKKEEAKAAAPEVKKEEAKAAAPVPVLEPELISLGIDVTKGEKVSLRGNLTALSEKTVNCVQYALTADNDGKLEIVCFVSVPAGKDLSKMQDQELTVEGTAYTVPNWKKRILRLDSYKTVK